VKRLMTGISYISTETLVWDGRSGWISWRRADTRSIELCWLPHDLRGDAFASHEMSAVFGARQGAVTILDFSEVIAMLKSWSHRRAREVMTRVASDDQADVS
jgi:hypothetical protein